MCIRYDDLELSVEPYTAYEFQEMDGGLLQPAKMGRHICMKQRRALMHGTCCIIGSSQALICHFVGILVISQILGFGVSVSHRIAHCL